MMSDVSDVVWALVILLALHPAVHSATPPELQRTLTTTQSSVLKENEAGVTVATRLPCAAIPKGPRFNPCGVFERMKESFLND